MNAAKWSAVEISLFLYQVIDIYFSSTHAHDMRPNTVSNIYRIIKMTFAEWMADDAPRLGAALAFYSILSMGPLLLIIISLAGIFFGQDAARGHIYAEISGLIGSESAEAIQSIIANSRNKDVGFWATLVGVITLLVAATGVFGQLQDALNIIWNVERKTGQRFKRLLHKRLLSFAMILGIGFLLLISLIISAALAALGNFMDGFLPEMVLQFVNQAISFGVTTLLFAMIFRIMPDIHIKWREVWLGAAITALLFTIGKYAIGLYLGQSALGSTFGAAGSLIVILIWVYYSAQILFLGAEFTQVYAREMST